MGRSHAGTKRLPAVAPARPAADDALTDVRVGADHADHYITSDGRNFVARLVGVPDELGGGTYLFSAELPGTVIASVLTYSSAAPGSPRDATGIDAHLAAVVRRASAGTPLVQPLAFDRTAPAGTAALTAEGVLLRAAVLHAPAADGASARVCGIGTLNIATWCPGRSPAVGSLIPSKPQGTLVCNVCLAGEERTPCLHHTLARYLVAQRAVPLIETIADEVRTAAPTPRPSGDPGVRIFDLPSGIEIETGLGYRPGARKRSLRIFWRRFFGDHRVQNTSVDGEATTCDYCDITGRAPIYRALGNGAGRCPEVRILDALE